MPEATAGWYPDPENPGYVAYFDGQAWVYDAEPSTPLNQPAPDQPLAPFPTFAAGWYPDPDDSLHVRYFDGQKWVNQIAPINPPRTPAPDADFDGYERTHRSVSPEQAISGEDKSAETPGSIENRTYIAEQSQMGTEAESMSIHEGQPVWFGRLQRAFSVRIGCLATLVGFVAAVLVSFIWVGLVLPVLVGVIALAWLGMIFADDSAPLRCPYCKKMVKINASACHHCGRILV